MLTIIRIKYLIYFYVTQSDNSVSNSKLYLYPMTCKLLHVTFTAILFITSSGCAIYAQSSPSVAPDDWILNTGKSDEFNGSTLDSSKWWTIDACFYTDSIRHGFNGGEGAFYRSQNVSVSNGNLDLTVDYNPDSLTYSYPCLHYHSYPFNSGGVVTALVNEGPDIGVSGGYSYGFYEMRAQLPGYYDSTGKSVGYGFYPTFWIAYQHAINGCVIKHDEVDILEPFATQYYDARTNVAGVWDEEGNCAIHKPIQDSVRSATPLFDGYHTFALMLLPYKFILYMDGQPFYSADTLTSPGLAHSINMAPYLGVNMSLGMGGYDYNSHPRPDAPFPEHMLIDYFRYYQLNPDFFHDNIIFQNTPNPFTGNTVIPYSVDNKSSTSFINIYNTIGKKVKSVKLTEKGNSRIVLDHTGLPSGIYLYTLVVDDKIIGTKKLVVF